MANDSAKDNVKAVERARALMKKIGFATLLTRDGSKLRARPMAAYVERDHDAIYFLSDARRRKVAL
jgi:general stress protein 26